MVDFKEIQRILAENDGQTIVICMGEGGYPNASKRKVQWMAEGELLFHEDGNGRTAALLKQSPPVLLLITGVGKGLKVKGRCRFIEEEETGIFKVFVQLEESFPF